MLNNAGGDNNRYAQQGCCGQDKALQGAKLLFLYHHRNEDRDIEGIESDDRQLGGVEAVFIYCFPLEEAAAREDEVNKPRAAGKESKGCGVVGHVGLFIHLGEYLGRYSLASGGERVDTAGAAEHKAVQRTQAGNNDEDIDDRRANGAEGCKGDGGAVLGDVADLGKTENAYVIEGVGCHNYQSTDAEGDRKIAL